MQSILDIKYKLEEQEKTAYGIAAQKLQEENKKLQQLMLVHAVRAVFYVTLPQPFPVAFVQVFHCRTPSLFSLIYYRVKRSFCLTIF